ncbi:uncharacterized protein LOC124654546 [Lolium rigidum]|uniref:uncharacterized protein LOC124654546 n=1 Tax=Lolium rigidum TaxID=89674 RepID=UPI001F5E2F7C|nr:uncharacterized protein LOC124654546 [Lolium rigidum]
MAMAASASCCSPPPPPPRLSPSSTRSSSCLIHTTSTVTRRPPANARCRRSRPGALPDTAVLVAGVAAVGVAATVLLRGDQKQQQAAPTEQEAGKKAEEACGACGGTGLCPRCKGEGFVFKEVAEETASKARRAAKNMATRYTAGLPTKWTYCNRCSSTRSCTACDGTGTTAAATK